MIDNQEIKKAILRKEKSIATFTDRKEASIAISSALGHSWDLAVAYLNAYPESREGPDEQNFLNGFIEVSEKFYPTLLDQFKTKQANMETELDKEREREEEAKFLQSINRFPAETDVGYMIRLNNMFERFKKWGDAERADIVSKKITGIKVDSSLPF